MEIQNIIFKIMNNYSNNWVRYYITKDVPEVNLPGEYVEIRSSYLTDLTFNDLLSVGFVIQKITTQMINNDAYCQVLFKRKLSTN